MKTWIRLAALLAALLFAFSAGAEEAALRGYSKAEGYVYVRMGQYPQTADGGVEPILWRALSADGEKVYLLSEYILFARTMHTSLKEYRDVLKGDFGGTELCRYLNTDFAAEAFSEEEMGMLMPCENFGKIFLLSRDDMKNKAYGLGTATAGTGSMKKMMADPGVRAWGTEWAIRNNGFPPSEYPDPKARVIGRAGSHISQGEMRLFVYAARDGSCSPYWSRSQAASDARHAVCTKGNGSIGHIEVGRDNEGVRPAVYLAQGAYQITGGSGTMENPYTIAAK